MPTVAVYDIAHKQVGDVELNDNIFGVEVNGALLHQAVVMQLASQRLGTHATKTRKARAMQEAARILRRFGLAAAWSLDRIRVLMLSACRANSVVSQSNALYRIKFRAAISSFLTALILRLRKRRKLLRCSRLSRFPRKL